MVSTKVVGVGWWKHHLPLEGPFLWSLKKELVFFGGIVFFGFFSHCWHWKVLDGFPPSDLVENWVLIFHQVPFSTICKSKVYLFLIATRKELVFFGGLVFFGFITKKQFNVGAGRCRWSAPTI